MAMKKTSFFHRLSTLSVCVIALSIFCNLPLAAQQGEKQAPAPILAETLAELEKINQTALGSDYAYHQLSRLADQIGPRLSGSPQAQQAVDYVAEEMRRLGLQVQLERLMVPHWVRGEETAALVEYPGQPSNASQKVVLTTLGGSVATPAEGLTALKTTQPVNAQSKFGLKSKLAGVTRR